MSKVTAFFNNLFAAVLGYSAEDVAHRAADLLQMQDRKSDEPVVMRAGPFLVAAFADRGWSGPKDYNGRLQVVIARTASKNALPLMNRIWDWAGHGNGLCDVGGFAQGTEETFDSRAEWVGAFMKLTRDDLRAATTAQRGRFAFTSSDYLPHLELQCEGTQTRALTQRPTAA